MSTSVSDEVTSYEGSYENLDTNTETSDNFSEVNVDNTSKQYKRNIIRRFKNEIMKSVDDVDSLIIIHSDILEELQRVPSTQEVSRLYAIFSSSQANINDKLSLFTLRNPQAIVWSELYNNFWNSNQLTAVISPYIHVY